MAALTFAFTYAFTGTFTPTLASIGALMPTFALIGALMPTFALIGALTPMFAFRSALIGALTFAVIGALTSALIRVSRFALIGAFTSTLTGAFTLTGALTSTFASTVACRFRFGLRLSRLPLDAVVPDCVPFVEVCASARPAVQSSAIAAIVRCLFMSLLLSLVCRWCWSPIAVGTVQEECEARPAPPRRL